jgi:hypothetical protein
MKPVNARHCTMVGAKVEGMPDNMASARHEASE